MDQADRLYRQAMEQMKKGSLLAPVTASNLLEQALEVHPHHIPSLLQLGEVAYHRGDSGACLHYAQKVLEVAPRDADALNLAGKAHLLRGHYRRARRMFGRALHIDSRHVRAAHNMALVDYYEGQTDRAIAGWERALAMDPMFELTLVVLMETYVEKGDLEKAIHYGERAWDVHPDHFETVQVLSQMYFMTERYDDVIAFLESEVRQRPMDLRVPSPWEGEALGRLARMMPGEPSVSQQELILLALSYLRTERLESLMALLRQITEVADSYREYGAPVEQTVGQLVQPIVMEIEERTHPVLAFLYETCPAAGYPRRAVPLLADVTTFLQYARKQTVHTVRGQGIAQGHKEELNRSFLVQDVLSPFGDRKFKGQRMRCLEALLVDAGLLQYGVDTLYVTEAGVAFLALPPREQFKRLFDTWLTTRRWNELFEIEDFSIYTGDSYDEYAPKDDEGKDIARRRRTILKHLKAFERGRVYPFQQLLERIQEQDYAFLRGPEEFDEVFGWRVHGGFLSMQEPATAWEDIEGRFIAFMLEGPCAWFQFVVAVTSDQGEMSFVVLPMVDALDVIPVKGGGDAVSYLPGSEIEVAVSQVGQFDLRDMEQFSDFRLGYGRKNVYGITKDSVERGVSAGVDVGRFLEVLDRNSAPGVPDLLLRQIRSWATQSVVSEEVVILQAEEGVADIIMETEALKKYVLRRLSPTVLEVNGPSVRMVSALLEEQVGPPKVLDPTLLEGSVQRGGKRTKREQARRVDVLGRTGGMTFALLADMDALLDGLQSKKVVLTTQTGVFPKKEIDALMEGFHIQDRVITGRATEPLFRRFAFLRHLAMVGGLAKVEKGINPRIRYYRERDELRMVLTEKGRDFLGASPDRKIRTLFDLWVRKIGWNPTLGRTDTPDTRAWFGPDEGGQERPRKQAVLEALRELDAEAEHSYDAFCKGISAEVGSPGEVYLDMMLREPLYWLGVLDVRLHRGRMATFRITEMGQWLLSKGRRFEVASDVMKVEATFEVLASLGEVDPLTFYELWRMAEVVSSERVTRFKITEKSVLRNRSLGRSTEEMVGFLERISSTPLPQNVVYSIREWGERFGTITIRRGTRMRFVSPDALAVFEEEHQGEGIERLSDTEVLVVS